MKTKLTMQMPEALEAADVKITGVVVLPDGEYQTLLATGQIPNQYLDRLNKYSKVVTLPGSCRISEYHSLLILNEGEEHGVAVCGRDYVAYSGTFPHAREWLQRRITKMADKMYNSTLPLNENFSQELSLGRLSEICDCTITADNGIGELLLEELKQREEITNIILHEDCFEINYYLDHVPESVPAGERFVSVIGLLGCNLEDFHLCHKDEEHELATINKLQPGTLTAQGYKDWADVLSAKVERIHNGQYGIQVDVSGCSANRLRDFSYMLAGHCSTKDYAQWVNTKDDCNENVQSIDENSSGMKMQ